MPTKCIPKLWTTWNPIKPEDTPEEIEEKNFYNSIIADKKPYFFRYKYKALSKEYNEYKSKADENAHKDFGKSLAELLKQKEDLDNGELVEPLTEKEANFVRTYYYLLPVIDTPCVMNNVCRYIEDIDFHIKQKVKSSSDFNYHTLQSGGFTPNRIIYEKIKEEVISTMKTWGIMAKDRLANSSDVNTTHENVTIKGNKEIMINDLKNRLLEICSNEESLANHLVYLFYEDCPSLSKSTLWSLVGRQIYENVSKNVDNFYFPVKDENGDIEFMFEKYSVKKMPVEKKVEDDVMINKIAQEAQEGV